MADYNNNNSSGIHILTENGSFGTGPFAEQATDLTCGTDYLFGVFATNSKGTGFYQGFSTFSTLACGTITHTATYSAGSHGSLTGTTSQIVVDSTDATAVTAVPDSGYQFSNWSDSSTQNPRTDTNVTGDITVTANFTAVQVVTHDLSYTAGSHGTLTGSTSQTVADGTNGTAVTAVPDSGYQFSKWSDNSTQNPRTDLNVTTDISVTANFTLIPVVQQGGGGSSGYSSGGSVATNPIQKPVVPVVPSSVNPPVSVLGSGMCPANLLLSQNLKQGAKDGFYNSYTHAKVNQVSILQKQLNRVLAVSYKQAAGPVDGKFGAMTKLGVQRLQMALNTMIKPSPLLKIDGVVGQATRTALNNSCGGM